MAKLRLVMGDKNLSSWSMRPYLALRLAGAPFDEEVVMLDRPDTAERIARSSPTGRVPVLVDGDLAVWESLAIVEYVAELFPSAGLWPADRAARARARSACAEMHSGFPTLRSVMSMNYGSQVPSRRLGTQATVRLDRGRRPRENTNVRARRPLATVTAQLRREVDRMEDLWRTCRAQYGGPFLFGAFGAADCFFAPVVTRFETYAPPVAADTREYVRAVLAHPVVAEWVREAEAEAERTGSHLFEH